MVDTLKNMSKDGVLERDQKLGLDAEVSVLGSRERILKAAEQEFAVKGFAGVRIDEIARLADVNKQLIYYYFKNKAGLYDGLLESLVDERAGYYRRLEKASLDEALPMLLESLQSSGVWEKLLSWEGSEFKESGGRIRLVERRTQRYSVQTEVFRRACAEGRLHDSLDPEMMSILFSTLMLSRSTLPQIVQMVTGLDPDSDEYADRVRTFTLELMRALRPKDAPGK